jgi:hypothetical protein
MAACPWRPSALYAASAVPPITPSSSAPIRRSRLRHCWDKPLLLTPPYGLVWMNVATCSIVTCPVGFSPTNPLSRPIPRPFIRGEPLGLSGKKSSFLWRRCLRISPRAGGSTAFAPMGALTRGGLSLLFGNHFVRRSVTICFDPDTTALLCQPEGSEETIQLPA